MRINPFPTNRYCILILVGIFFLIGISTATNFTEYAYGTPTCSVVSGGLCSYLFDGSTSSAFLTNVNATIKMDYGAGVSRQINQITVWSHASYATHAPREFIFEGSTDDITYTKLLEVSNNTAPAGRSSGTMGIAFNFTNTNAYRYYKLTPLYSDYAGRLGSSGSIGLSEIDLKNDDDSNTTLPYFYIPLSPNSSFTYTDWATYYASSVSVFANAPIQFTDASVNHTGTITNWYWVFGDGTSSTEQNPIKSYTSYGAKNVNLTIKVNNTNVTVTKTVYVVKIFDNPQYLFGYPNTAIGTAPGGGTLLQAFDRSTSTYWQAGDESYLGMDYGRPITVNGMWTNAPGVSYPTRAPQAFSVEASNDNSNWTVIYDEYKNKTLKVTPRQTTNLVRYYNFSAPVTYRYYRVQNTLSRALTAEAATATAMTYAELDFTYSDPTLLYPNFKIEDSIMTALDYNSYSESITLMKDHTYLLNSTTVNTTYPITNYYWDVNSDNITESTDSSYSYTPTTLGSRTARLTVNDGVNGNQTKAITINVVTSLEPLYGEYGATSASSITGGNPMYIFDGTNEDAYAQAWLSSPPASDQWVKVDYGADRDIVINELEIRASTTYTQNTPRIFSLQGSNDNSNWTDLDNRTTTQQRAIPRYGNALSGYNYYMSSFNNSVSYRYYKLYINSTDSTQIASASGVIISEIRLRYHDPTAWLDADLYLNGDGYLGTDTYQIRNLNYQAFTVIRNKPVTFKDYTTGNPDSWIWEVTGDGVPDGFTQDYTTTYPTVGVYTGNMSVSDGVRTSYKTFIINVVDSFEYPYWYGENGGIATASSTTQGNPNYLFDGDNQAAFAQAWYAGTEGIHWIQMYYGNNEARIVNEIQIRSSSTYPQSVPRQFEINASNDGTTWVSLDKRLTTGNMLLRRDISGTEIYVYNITNTNAYNYYRITMFDSSTSQIVGTVGYVISEIALKYHDPVTFPIDPQFYIERDGVNGEISQKDDYGINSGTYDTLSALTGRQIQFKDISLGSPDSWSWTFGDGTTNTTQNPVKTYSTAGEYLVNMTITKGSTVMVKTKRVYVMDAFEYAYNYKTVLGATYAQTASSTTQGNPFYLFDGDNQAAFAQAWYAGTEGIHWIQMYYGQVGGTARVINEIQIRSSSTYPQSVPRQFEINASNDGTTWVSLDKRLTTGNMLLRRDISGTEIYVYNITNTNAYNYYRITMFDSSTSQIVGTVGYVISEIALKYHDPTIDPQFYIERDGVNGEISQKDDYGINSSTYDTLSALTGRQIQFKDISLGSPDSWSWTFGDGTTNTTQNPVKTYSTAGEYLVNMTITKGSTVMVKTKRVYVMDAFEYAYNYKTVLGATYAQTASSTTQGNPFYLFDGDNQAGLAQIWAVYGGGLHWIKMDYGATNSSIRVTINEVSITPSSSYSSQAPLSFRISGSNDNTNWTLLDNRTESAAFNRLGARYSGGTPQKWGFINPNGYRYYNITTITSGTDNVYISEIALKYHEPSTYVDTDFTVNRSYLTYDNILATPLSRSVYKNEKVYFTDNSTGTGLTYKWDLNGDDITDSTNESTNWTYIAAGSYIVNHTAINSYGNSASKYMTIVVTDIVEPVYGLDVLHNVGNYFSVTGPSYYSNGYLYNILDHTASTRWWINSAPPKSIIYDYGGGVSYINLMAGFRPPAINTYRIQSGTDATERSYMPTAWSVYGSNTNTGTGWTLLDTQTGQPGWGSSETRYYNFTNTVPYRYYNFTVTAAGATNIIIPELNYLIRNITELTTPPNANFTFTPASANIYAQKVTFNDTSTNFPELWLWDFGDGYTSTSQNPTHWYSVNGTYPITLTTTNAGGSTQITKNYTQNSDWDSGVISWLHFNGSVDSTTITDQAGNSTWSAGGNAKISNTVMSGYGNGSLILDGASDISTTDPGFDMGSKNVTLEVWFKRGNTNSTGVQVIVSKSNLSSSGYILYIVNGKLSFSANSLSDQVILTENGTTTDTNWHFATVVRNINTWNLYKDGINVSRATWSGTVASNSFPLRLGKTDYTSPYTFNGNLDEFRYSDYVRWNESTYFSPAYLEYNSATEIPLEALVVLFSSNNTDGMSPLTVKFTDTSRGSPSSWNWSFRNVTGNDTQVWWTTTQNPVYTFGAGNWSIKLNATNAIESNMSDQTTFINVTPRTIPTASFTSNVSYGLFPLGVQFNDTSDGMPDEWNWSFGDGTYDSIQNASKQYSTGGNFTVILNVTNSEGSNTKTSYITVWNRTNASFTANSTGGITPQTIQFTDGSSNATARNWSFQNVTGNNTEVWFSQLQSPTYTFGIGNFSIRLNVSNTWDTNLSTQTTFVNVSQIPPPTPDFTMNVSSGLFTLGVGFNDTSTGTPTSWNWSFGDGYLSTTKNTTHAYSTGGNYTVNLTTTNAGGSTSKIKYVTIYNRTTSAFSGTPVIGIVPFNVVFTGVAGNGTTYFWIFGDGNTTDNALLSPEHYYTVAGNYSVNFSVSNGQSTNWTNKSNYITTAEIPVVSFTASNITGIATAIVNFTDTSSNAPTTWVWNATNVTGNNTPFTFSYAKHPTYTFRIGNFSITLNASNAVGNGISTQTTFINVSQVPAPVSDFSMNVSSGVFSLDVEFNDTSTGTPTSWNWSFGDGYLSTTKNTTHVFSTGGNYTINLTSTNAGGSSSQIKYVTVYNRTTSSFSGTPLSGNIPLNVVFTGVAGNGTTYFWIFGDGNTTDNSLLSPEHYYTSVGNYSVNFSVSNGQYTNWTNWSEYITASLGAIVPVASFTASNTTGTTTVIVNFTDTSSNTPTDWEWYATNVTGNSTQFTFSSEQNPVYTFRSGNFSIKLNASNPAGFNISEQTTFINVSVDIPPVSDFTMNTSSGLFPLGVEFNDTSTGGVITNWNWSFGDGYRSTNQNATHAYSTGGNYTVNLTVTNDGGSTSKIKYVTVYNRTTSAFSGTPTTINVPFNVVFTGVAGNGTTYLWIFGDGNTTDNSLLSPEHYYTVAGNYSVNFSVSNGEYTNWTNKSNYITANPEIFVPYASFTASNLTGITTAVVKFTDTSNNTPTGWVWNATNVTGNNTPFTFSTSQNPTYTFRIGNFSIKLKANTTSGYNVSEQTTFINVSPNTPPVSDFSMSTNSGLFPLVVVFTDTSTGVRSSWNWSFGDGNISTSQNPTHIYGSGGNYTINLTVTNDGGSSSKIKYATVYNTTTSAFTGTPLTGTVPFSVAFTGVAGNGTTYFWIFGDGNTTSNTQLSPEHYYRAAGNHSVNFSVSNGQYTNWTNKSLYIAAFSIGIVADFTSNTTLGSLPLAVQFNDTSTNNPTAWDWDFGDGTAHSYEQNPVHTYAVSGTYTVTMTASKLGSADVVTKLNYIQAITPGSDFTANITTGIFPLTIQFTDLSGGTPNAWNWYFGDGTVHVTEQNPLHTYTRSGTYTVILSVITGGVSYTQTKTNYITVTDATPVTQFRGDPLTGNEPLIVQFYDQSANAPTSWDWNFGDGTAHSTERNPIHTFENENMYTVTLTATNSYGSTPKTKINYIEVTAMEGLLMTDPVNVNTSSYCVEFNGRNIGAPTTVWFEYGMIQDYTNGFKSFKTPNQTGITGNYSYSQCGIPIIPGESYKVQSAGDVMGLYVYGMNRTFVVPDARAHPTTTYEVQVNKFVEDGLDPISLLTYDVWQPYLGLMGGLFFAILIAFIFMNIVIKQRTVSLTIIVLLLTGTAVWRLLPPAFVQVAQMLFIAGIAGILYWLFVKRR